MNVLRLVLLISLVVLTAKAQQNSVQQPGTQPRSAVPASCPVTTPPEPPFIPPIYDELSENEFPVGTEKLWTYLSKSGIWEWEPHKPGHEHQVQPLTVKITWLSVDYDWRTELRPNLTVTGKRLDGPASPLLLLPPTNIAGRNARYGFMLSGVYVPTPGCWEITGDYKGQKLSFVVWVQPVKQGNQ